MLEILLLDFFDVGQMNRQAIRTRDFTVSNIDLLVDFLSLSTNKIAPKPRNS